MYSGAVNIELKNKSFIPFEDYLKPSIDLVNKELIFNDIYGNKIVSFKLNYTKLDSKTLEKPNFTLIKNRGSYYFETDIGTDVNSMSYDISSDKDISFSDNSLIIDNIKVDFNEALVKQNISTKMIEVINKETSETNYKLEFSIVDGKTGSLSVIDPTVTLDYNSDVEDIYYEDRDIEYGSQIKWNISSIRTTTSKISEAKLCLHLLNGDNWGWSDNTYFWRINDQTWTESSLASTINSQSYSLDTTGVWNNTITDDNTWICRNISGILQIDLDSNNNYSTIRLEMEKYPITGSNSISDVTDTDTIYMGATGTGSWWSYNSREEVDTSIRPYLEITYPYQLSSNLTYPTTSNTKTVSENQNISIYFNVTSGGSLLTSGVTWLNGKIGGNKSYLANHSGNIVNALYLRSDNDCVSGADGVCQVSFNSLPNVSYAIGLSSLKDSDDTVYSLEFDQKTKNSFSIKVEDDAGTNEAGTNVSWLAIPMGEMYLGNTVNLTNLKYIKCNNVSAVGTSGALITFTTPFPDNQYSVFCTSVNDTDSPLCVLNSTKLTTSFFADIEADDGTNEAVGSIDWCAISRGEYSVNGTNFRVGNHTTNATGSRQVTFTTVMSNADYIVITTDTRGTAGAHCNCPLTSKTNSGFVVNCTEDVGAICTSMGFDYIAVDIGDYNLTTTEIYDDFGLMPDNHNWTANITTPSGLTGLQDLMINVSYSGNAITTTEANAINYGSTQTNYSRTVNLSISLDSSINRKSTVNKINEESINANILLSRLQTLKRTIEQSATMNTIVNRLASSLRFISAVLTLDINSLRTYWTSRTNNENILVSDNVNRILKAIRTESENIIVSATINRLQSLKRVISQVIESNLVISIRQNIQRNINQSVSLIADISRLFSGKITISQFLNIDVSINRIQTLFKNVSDSINLNSVLSRLFKGFREVDQSIEITADSYRFTSMQRTIIQEFNIDESVLRKLIAERGILQLISMDIDSLRNLLLERGISQAINMNDEAIRRLFSFRESDIVISVIDSLFKSFTRSITIFQSISIDGIIDRTSSFFRIIAGDLSILTYINNPSGLTNYLVNILQEINLNSAVNRMASFFRTVNNVIDIDSVVSRFKSVLVNILEFIKMIFGLDSNYYSSGNVTNGTTGTTGSAGETKKPCVKDSDCEENYKCINNECVLVEKEIQVIEKKNWSLIILGIVLGVLLLISIALTIDYWRKHKKRKKENR